MLSIYKNKYSQNNGIRKQLKNCAKYNAKSYVKLLSDIETIFNLSNYLGTYYVVINNIFYFKQRTHVPSNLEIWDIKILFDWEVLERKKPLQHYMHSSKLSNMCSTLFVAEKNMKIFLYRFWDSLENEKNTIK